MLDSNWQTAKFSNKNEFEMIDELSLINPILSKIMINHKLSPEEFKLVWKILKSRRTKYSINTIWIIFNVLSECLEVLSLCAECSQLEIIYFHYYKSNKRKEQKSIDIAVKEFTKKFGIIRSLTLKRMYHDCIH